VTGEQSRIASSTRSAWQAMKIMPSVSSSDSLLLPLKVCQFDRARNFFRPPQSRRLKRGYESFAISRVQFAPVFLVGSSAGLTQKVLNGPKP
jgi:hypothetical protein